jgi:SAM-dependent methyltransferase
MDPSYAARYGALERWHWWFRGRQRIVADVLARALAPAAARTVCAVGCGPAEGISWLRAFAGSGGRVIGLDADPVHARTARGVEYVIGRAEAAPLARHSVDLVIAMDVLEHVDDDAGALREIGRVLKPDGLLLVTVPALPSLWGAQDTINLHRRRYTRASLRDAFARAGLPAPRMTYFNTLLFPVVAAVRWSRKALGLADRMRTDFDDNRPGMINDALERLFAAERHLIRHAALPVGVSLLATLRPAEHG